MNKTLNVIAISVLLTVLHGCYSKETVSSNLIVSCSDIFAYQIEIPILNEGRGNIHTFDMSKYEFNSSHFIYTNSIMGIQKDSSLVLTYYPNKIEYPWIQSNLRGYVEFINDSITIILQTPIYIDDDEIPEKWVNYIFNGTYFLENDLK